MKALRRFIFSVVALVAGPAVAGSFPTTWQIINNSDIAIDVVCSGKNPGGSRSIELDRKTIKSRETFERVWGEEWYNDGLGLQAASWECEAGLSGGSLVKAGGFSTDWGQNMILSVAQTKSGFVIRSQIQKGDVAKAASEKDKLAK